MAFVRERQQVSRRQAKLSQGGVSAGELAAAGAKLCQDASSRSVKLDGQPLIRGEAKFQHQSAILRGRNAGYIDPQRVLPREDVLKGHQALLDGVQVAARLGLGLWLGLGMGSGLRLGLGGGGGGWGRAVGGGQGWGV